MEVDEIVETSSPSINRRPEKGPTMEARLSAQSAKISRAHST
jgi:hypothetical protein